MIQKFVNSTIGVAGFATFSSIVAPEIASAQGDDIKYQVYSLQQSLRATNARVDQLEKQLSNWTKTGKQEPVSYAGNKGKQARIQPSTQGGSIHHVASGDTLSSISRRYGIGLDRIVASNPGLDPHRIRIGQPIVIPQSGAGAPAKPSPASTPGGASSASGTGGSYTVKAGDTLSSIARRHGTSSDQLMTLNSLSDPNTLRIGQRLRVPGGGGGAPESSSGNRFGGSKASTPAPAPAPEPEQSSSELLTAPEGYGYYEVISKDTLYSIALSFGTTSRELRRLNKLDGDDSLAVGQYLLVPVADDSLYES